MLSFGLAELAVLAVLIAVGLLVVAFCLALAAFRRVRNLERRLEGSGADRMPRH